MRPIRDALSKHSVFAVRWLREVAIWLCELWVLWVGLALVAVTFHVGFRAECLERGIRVAGMLLQLVGFALVAFVLMNTGKLFARAQPVQFIRAWLRRFPKYGPRNVILGAGGATLGVFTASGRGRVTSGPNTPLEDRVAMLERGYASLFDEVGKVDERLVAHVKDTKDSFTRESSDRKLAIDQVTERLTSAVAGDLHLQILGVVLFVLGVIAASASPELLGWFGGQTSCAAFQPLWAASS